MAQIKKVARDGWMFSADDVGGSLPFGTRANCYPLGACKAFKRVKTTGWRVHKRWPYLFTYVAICLSIYSTIHMYIYKCIYIYKYTNTNTYPYAYTHAHTHASTHIYIYIYLGRTRVPRRLKAPIEILHDLIYAVY